MSISIRTHEGHVVRTEADSEATLEQAIFLTGVWEGVPLCSGLGRCGLCRVRFRSKPPKPAAEDRRRFSREELANGWRLACLHPANPCDVEIPEPVRAARTGLRAIPKLESFDLTVDLGTTTMHWAAASGDEVIAEGGELNPQNGLGAEIMSRLAHAATPEGAQTLRDLVSRRIRKLVLTLEEVSDGRCGKLVISGNAAMVYLLLGMDPRPLSSAPYGLEYRGGDKRTIAEGIPVAYIPPLLAPFVGADISAGLLAVEINGQPPEYPYLLADLGTNGEFVLALSPEERLIASVPMGPALEGVGLAFGRTAGPGSVTGFDLTPMGLHPRRLPGRTEHPGMTGTAYLSLCANLLSLGLLDESGRFGHGTTPLAARFAARVVKHRGEPAFDCGDGLFLPASDVEEILKVKAAFDLAVSALLREAGIGPSALKIFHLAGALGEHVGIGDLERLGFLPSGAAGRVKRSGNTSLRGSLLLLRSEEARRRALELPVNTRLLDLTEANDFTDEYVKRMRFTHVG